MESSNDIATDGTISGVDLVTIDGEEYRVGTTRAAELVGYYVEFIYDGTDGENTILYIAPSESRNTEIDIASRDIESYSDYTYEYYDNDRLRTRRINKDFTLVYNGRTVSDGFDESMMTPELGSVKLLGSGSGDYNMVYVTSYETVIVSSVNRTTYDVYHINNRKYNFEDDGVAEIPFI